MKEIFEFVKPLVTPEVVSSLIALLIAFCIKRGWVVKASYDEAKELLADGGTVSEVTDKTRLIAEEVHAVNRDMKNGDTSRKKFMRTGRAILKALILR